MEKYLPITSFFSNINCDKEKNIFFRFTLKYDKFTDLIHLEKYKNNPNLAYRHEWMTCFEPEKHLDDLVDRLINRFFYKSNLNIFGYSFKDDSTLKRMKIIFNENVCTHNIKLSKEIGLPSNGACLEKLFEFTKYSNFETIVNLNGHADILIVRHVLEHSWDMKNFLSSLKYLISKNGLIVFEVPDCEKGLRNGMQTLLWEEHASYFTEASLLNVLRINGFKTLEIIRYPNQIEDSLVFITKLDQAKVNLNFQKQGESLLKIFSENFEKKKLIIQSKVEELISLGFKICIFGAGHHASAFVSMNELNKVISFVVDDNKNKKQHFLPGSCIPIFPTDYLQSHKKNIFIFLTTNPENNIKIAKFIESINKNIKTFSIFDFYKA